MPIFTAEERVGQTVAGKYRLERILGEGGMGVVFDARHEALGRPVAVKFLHVALAREDEVVRRFLNEARAASSLAHPNVVDVLDVGAAEDGVPYIVMERLEGESLASCLEREGTLRVDDAWARLRPAMEAIAFAHARGVVHRDLKPDNVFLHRNAKDEPVTKVLDFGIAKLASDAPSGGTATGAVLGTALYMAPEQSRGRGVGAWSDVWAMGIVWYETLTGRFPFDADHASPTTEVLVRLSVDPPMPIATYAPSVPRAIAAVIDRALSKDVATRHADMRAMLREMDAAFAASPVAAVPAPPHPAVAPRRRVQPGALAAGLVVALGALVALASASGGSPSAETTMAPPASTTAPVTATLPPASSATPTLLAPQVPDSMPLAQGVDPPDLELASPPSSPPSASSRPASSRRVSSPPPPQSTALPVEPPHEEPAAARAQPTRDEVLAVMGRIAPTLRACGEYQHGIARVRVFVDGPSGHVSRAVLTGVLSNTLAGSCVVRSLRAISFPPFEDGEFVFTYPIEI